MALKSRGLVLSLVFWLCFAALGRGEDGYRLWLRYDRIGDEHLRTAYIKAIKHVALETSDGRETPRVVAARAELTDGLRGLLGVTPEISVRGPTGAPPAGSEEGYLLRHESVDTVVIAARSDVGVLYGAFALLRAVQTNQPVERLSGESAPKIARRLLNHWDNLDRSIERGYAGFSLWDWFYLPEIRSPRYRDYARACASIGINGTVLNNVNADARILSSEYLKKVAALAQEFRPYGVRVYLSVRWTSPMELSGLKTADPLDAEVAAWWRAKVDEVYREIPDFGGFLVKANSEGQPGPQSYGRTHADGANMLADALTPHGGIVMWRAFVYEPKPNVDRLKQAYLEFAPLDGKFRENVAVQIKNGPLDFMPREPFHPLFGAMPQTAKALEVQITQEYLGQGVQLAYLAPMWKETLDSDTYATGEGSTVARVIEGASHRQKLTVIAGVANVGDDRNWTGHPLHAANWYAFGRLAWDPGLAAEAVGEEWIRQTFSSDPAVTQTLGRMLMGSREIVVSYTMPLGLHHIMAEGHHYGPGPWNDEGRQDWRSTYYHRADASGLGADRTASGSNVLEQYAPEVARRWANLEDCPENLLLWFHHVPWDHRMKSGRTLWDELCFKYQEGVEGVRQLQRDWASLKGRIDDERFEAVAQRLQRQETDAREWRDACLLYFQTFSKRPLPAGVEQPEHDLDYYESIRRTNMPGYMKRG